MTRADIIQKYIYGKNNLNLTDADEARELDKDLQALVRYETGRIRAELISLRQILASIEKVAKNGKELTMQAPPIDKTRNYK